MTLDEALAIRAAICALRPEWTADAVWDVVWNPDLRCRSAREVAVAAAWVATDPSALTPDRLLAAGPWWTAAMTEPARTVAHDATECEHHPGHQAKTCTECAAVVRPPTAEDMARLKEIAHRKEQS